MTKLVAEGISVDLPIYDARSRSLRHALVLGPLASAVAKAPYVGGTITQGAAKWPLRMSASSTRALERNR
jgi:hypothetical protein